MTHFFEIVYLVVAVSLIHTFDSIEGKLSGEKFVLHWGILFCFHSLTQWCVGELWLVEILRYALWCGTRGPVSGPIFRPKVLKDTSTDCNLIFFYSASAARNNKFVTCGSVLKLLNVDYRVRLHSHDVKYGTGSGQQSVTATEVQEDVNSHWSVMAATGKHCERGWVWVVWGFGKGCRSAMFKMIRF